MKKLNIKRSEIKNPPANSVIVFYERPASHATAVGYCEQFTRQQQTGAESKVGYYSLDTLSKPVKGEETIRAAAQANVLAFAVHASGDFPAVVKIWAEQWLLRRKGRSGWLVGLITDEEIGIHGVACLKEIYIRHLAHRAGMDYLSHFPIGIRRVMPDSLDAFSQHADHVTPMLEEILHGQHIPIIPPLN